MAWPPKGTEQMFKDGDERSIGIAEQMRNLETDVPDLTYRDPMDYLGIDAMRDISVSEMSPYDRGRMDAFAIVANELRAEAIRHRKEASTSAKHKVAARAFVRIAAKYADKARIRWNQ